MKRIALLFLLLSTVACDAWPRHNGGASTPSGPVATLSAQSALALGWGDARGSVTTNTGSGNLFSAVFPAASNPTISNVKNCTGGAVTCSTTAISSSGTKSPLKLGDYAIDNAIATGSPLSSVTSYKMWFVQTTSGGDSNLVGTSSFTTFGKLLWNNVDWAGNPAGHNWSDAPSGTNTVRTNAQAYLTKSFSPPVADLTVGATWEYAWNTANTTVNCHASSSSAVTSRAYTGASGIRAKLQAIPTANNAAAIATYLQALPSTEPSGLNSGNYINSADLDLAITTGGNDGFGNIQEVRLCDEPGGWDLTATGDGTCGSAHTCMFGTILHEVTEVLGRLVFLDSNIPDNAALNGYSALNTRNFTSTGTRNLTLDAGSTWIYGTGSNQGYNQNWGGGDPGDIQNVSTSYIFSCGFPCGPVGIPQLTGDIYFMLSLGYLPGELAMTNLGL